MRALRRSEFKNASRIVSRAAGKEKPAEGSRVVRSASFLSSNYSNNGIIMRQQEVAVGATQSSVGFGRNLSMSTATRSEEEEIAPTTEYVDDEATTFDRESAHVGVAATTTQRTKLPPLLDYEGCLAMTKILEEPDFHKVGAFSAATWKSIHHLVKSWAIQFPTGESVDASFALCDRLVMEQELLMQNAGTVAAGRDGIVATLVEGDERFEMQQVSREILDTNFLNILIKNWVRSWKQRETKVSPKAILPLIEEYIDRSPTLHPNAKTYNMLIDAINYRFEKDHCEKLASEIFHRMSKEKLLTTTKSRRDSSNNIKKNHQLFPTPILDEKLRCINDISPDHYTYTTLINVFAHSHNPQAAEEVLCKFTNAFLNGEVKTQPNAHAFTSCMKAWARSRLPESVEKCETIIELMGHLDKQPPLQNVTPTVISYNALLDCWAKSGREDAGEKAEILLKKMEGMKHIQPDAVSYNTVMYAHEQTDGNIKRAKKIMTRMFGRHKTLGEKRAVMPSRDAYMILLKGINRDESEDKYKGIKAETLLRQMVEAGYQPCLLAYNITLNCWARSKMAEGGQRTEKILNIMKDPPRELNIEPVRPNTLSYASVVTSYHNANHTKKTEEFFWEMYEENKNGNETVNPDVRQFNTVVAAWKNDPYISDPEKLKQILRLFKSIPKSGPLAIQPDVVSCNTLLQALSEMKTEEHRANAVRVFNELVREYEESNDESLRPDLYTYTFLMRAHANVGDIGSTRDAFNLMVEDYKNGNEKAKPDIVPFNNMLISIARGSRNRNKGAGQLADKVLERLSELKAAGITDAVPIKRTYDIKINCWANSGSLFAGEEADNIIKEMEEKAASGFPEFQPDVVSYTTAMNAHAKSGDYLAAEKYFTRMVKEYTNGNKAMKPGLKTINTILSAFAKANDPAAAEKAESYLREMLVFGGSSQFDLIPNAVSFTSVISAWANSGDPRAGERAISLFQEIETLAAEKRNMIRLDSGFYRAVIHACAVSGDTTTAEALIKKINDKELKYVKPDRYMYNALLKAYANSGDTDIAEKAESVLKHMIELSSASRNTFVKPHYECYMNLLECWGNAEDQEKAAERSEAILEEMERQGKSNLKMRPTAETYTRVINTMSRCGHADKTKALLKRMYDNTDGEAFPV